MEAMAETIKEMRKKYGLSQKAFAALLGIGEATMVRYEKGAIPTRANANLILAAEDPRFMEGCLKRNGDAVTDKQRANAERYVYACIKLDEVEEEPAMTEMDEIYEFTLRQEVLNEKAAEIVCQFIRYFIEEGISMDDRTHPLVMLASQLFEIKVSIVRVENRDNRRLDEIEGYLRYLGEYVRTLMDARGVA